MLHTTLTPSVQEKYTHTETQLLRAVARMVSAALLLRLDKKYLNLQLLPCNLLEIVHLNNERFCDFHSKKRDLPFAI